MPKKSLIPSSIGRLAVITSILIWCLILVGGIVHGTGSSLACPDWPTCFGTFFPEMKGGVFFEHSHRLFAALIGLLTFSMMVLLLKKGDRQLKWAGVVAFTLVLFQGVLGGITVLLRLPALVSIAHLATSFFFLLWMVRISVLVHPSYPLDPAPEIQWGSSKKLLLLTILMVYFQSVLGATVRHLGAGLACLDIPFCQGVLWPAEGFSSMKLHMLHRIFGVLTAVAVMATTTAFLKKTHQPKMRLLLLLAPGLVLIQILLGVWSVLSTLGLFQVTAHLGVAALLLVDLWLVFLLLPQDTKNEMATPTLPNIALNQIQES